MQCVHQFVERGAVERLRTVRIRSLWARVHFHDQAIRAERQGCA